MPFYAFLSYSCTEAEARAGNITGLTTKSHLWAPRQCGEPNDTLQLQCHTRNVLVFSFCAGVSNLRNRQIPK